MTILALLSVGCDSSSGSDTFSGSDPGDSVDQPPGTPAEVCELPSNRVVDGGPGKDGIPALTNPPTVSAAQVDYLQGDDRVIGLILDGKPLAVPHNILWWHEIMNYDGALTHLAVTYCPLTGSSIVFNRNTIGGAELGVSGLLYQNNLIMYDRSETEALWSQMLIGQGCTSSKGVTLTTIAHVEMTWAGWKALHPDTQVLSETTGFSRNYTRYPYGDYEEVNNGRLLFRMNRIDDRRPPKERVLGIPGAEGRALTFPFGMLNDIGTKAVVPSFFEGEEVVVLWDASKEAAAAFRPRTISGQAVRLQVENGRFVDTLSGSEFEVNGVSTAGGLQMEPVEEAYVAFWFSWPAFHPQTDIFSDPS